MGAHRATAGLSLTVAYVVVSAELMPDISGDQETITEALFSSVLGNVWLLLGNSEADLQQSPR